MPQRIQRKRTKGWKMPANTVVVSRPSKFGNHFHLRKFCKAKMYAKSMIGNCPQCCDSATEAVEKYRDFVKHRLLIEPNFLESLRGKNIACFCPLTDKDGKRSCCHADVLLELANKPLSLGENT